MPIYTTKPTAPAAEERYENGRVSRITGRQLYEDQGVSTRLQGIKNSKIYTINENQGFWKTLFGRRPAKITRITGTRFTQPDTMYVETPGSYPGTLMEPRIATKENQNEYNIMQRRFNTAYGVARKQQGGSVNTQNAEQQELQYALIGYVVATKKQPKDENEINQIAQQLVQLKQQDPQKYNQLVQIGQQAQQQQQATKAERGAKLNYIKQLKGSCPEGEELVYFKKGGMINCGCQKKEKGAPIEQPKKKANAVQEFKTRRKKC